MDCSLKFMNARVRPQAIEFVVSSIDDTSFENVCNGRICSRAE
jgi:hypothetical protein